MSQVERLAAFLHRELQARFGFGQWIIDYRNGIDLTAYWTAICNGERLSIRVACDGGVMCDMGDEIALELFVHEFEYACKSEFGSVEAVKKATALIDDEKQQHVDIDESS